MVLPLPCFLGTAEAAPIYADTKKLQWRHPKRTSATKYLTPFQPTFPYYSSLLQRCLSPSTWESTEGSSLFYSRSGIHPFSTAACSVSCVHSSQFPCKELLQRLQCEVALRDHLAHGSLSIASQLLAITWKVLIKDLTADYKHTQTLPLNISLFVVPDYIIGKGYTVTESFASPNLPLSWICTLVHAD